MPGTATHKLLAFVKDKAEAGRIHWENDGPVFSGLCEAAEEELHRLDSAKRAIGGLLSLLKDMQETGTRYLQGSEDCDSRWYISRMLWLTDGPIQRELERDARRVLDRLSKEATRWES